MILFFQWVQPKGYTFISSIIAQKACKSLYREGFFTKNYKAL